MRISFRRAAAIASIAMTACLHNQGAESDFVPRPDPIPIYVRNENFLDMNVFVVTSGISRRIGTVTGNAAANFKIDWTVANGQSITITATPIGGRGTASSGALNVGIGQVIDFKIAAQLRQSVASVHDP